MVGRLHGCPFLDSKPCIKSALDIRHCYFDNLSPCGGFHVTVTYILTYNTVYNLDDCVAGWCDIYYSGIVINYVSPRQA